ncbi:hypothetical protein [Membranihabitans marinus]|uniref:hypothetical protein n=1 Tax=Membranihabitans marinus TaxID=1227546 RepID=UPI001F229E99|nr:hypothetical protein [Membranihabitans marinus]
MKSILFILTLLFLAATSFAQNDTIAVDTNTYRIIKTDGGEFIGKILSEDPREILLLVNGQRKIYIPQHLILEKIVLKQSDLSPSGQYIGEDKFATRYFITTNGLALKKDDHYIQWNLYGPSFQFGLNNNWGMGIMTSWLGIPLIGTIKKSWEVNEKTQIALGGLIGTGSWAAYDIGGGLPFATLSLGDRSKNIAISGGYGMIWEKGSIHGRGLSSIAGMIKVSTKISLVFDSFIFYPSQKPKEILPYETNTSNQRSGFALFIPGLRWHREEGKAFQFGFTTIFADGRFYPVPIPMIQMYRGL